MAGGGGGGKQDGGGQKKGKRKGRSKSDKRSSPARSPSRTKDEGDAQQSLTTPKGGEGGSKGILVSPGSSRGRTWSVGSRSVDGSLASSHDVNIKKQSQQTKTKFK